MKQQVRKIYSTPSINKIKINRVTLGGSRPSFKEKNKKYIATI